MNKHKVYCIIARTAHGKTVITKQVAKDLKMRVLKSYTTRGFRDDETVETSDHIHISKEDVEKFRDKMIAYTVIKGEEYFATCEQLLESDFYIIDPVGYYSLCLKTKDMNIKLVPIYITVPKSLTQKRAQQRGDKLKDFNKRYEDEDKQFTEFEKSRLADYYILNTGTFDEAVDKMKSILNMERDKD